VAQNPRIDELRQRLAREPGSRLFAQLAEELRKEGEVAEAVRLCRDGLAKHPAYTSAHMTLGRALMDTGDLPGARIEFETVLRGASDNILASRFLGECLEGLGDLKGAADRYKTTLAMSPGDRQLQARLEGVQGRLLKPTPPPLPAGPIPLSPADDSFEFEGPGTLPAAPPSAPSPTPHVAEAAGPESPAPIPLVAVDEPFELERPGGMREEVRAEAVAEAPLAAPAPAIPDEPSFDFEPEVRPVEEAPPTHAFFEVPEEVEAIPVEPEETFRVEAAPEVHDANDFASTTVPPLADMNLSSATLAELYFNQGFMEQAIGVYRELLLREPGNSQARARLTEIEALDRHLRGDDAKPAPVAEASDPKARRRLAIERTIERLEQLRQVLRRA
jgi:tetratricopeptide (TPR) repeat protein